MDPHIIGMHEHTKTTSAHKKGNVVSHVRLVHQKMKKKKSNQETIVHPFHHNCIP